MLVLDELQLLAVTETNLNESVEDAELCVGDWKILRRDRSDGRAGGGVLLAARSPIFLERMSHLETTFGEDLWARFQVDGQYIYVCVVYIPPNVSDHVYTDWFERVENVSTKVSSTKILIVGDLNYHSASTSTLLSYDCFLYNCDLSQFNKVTNKNNRILDAVLTSPELSNRVYVRGALPGEELSVIDGHHPPLFICVEYKLLTPFLTLPPSNIRSDRDWDFTKGDYAALYNLIKTASWTHLNCIEDPNEAVEIFNTAIYDVFNICIPKKNRKRISSRVYPVFYTRQIIADIKFKHNVHRMWKLSGNNEHLDQFKCMRTKLKKDINTAYDSYVKNMSSQLSRNPTKFWQYINSLRCRGGLETKIKHGDKECQGAEIATAFAEHFQSVFLPDAPALDPSAADAASVADSRRVEVQAFSTDEVRRAIKKLRSNTGPGPDAVPPYVIKGCIDYIIKPITYIFNIILSSGIYPLSWKESRVTPIPKSGSKLQVENYRPVAILCSLAKVLEMALHARILPQCMPYITPAQHAFLPKRSVTTNLVSLVSFMSKELDDKKQVDIIYLDFQKAFDRVDNDVLLRKLGDMGVVPGLLKLFASYLSERRQFVRYGPYHSASYKTLSGISQGSNLGPLLFNILINDLPAQVQSSMIMMFADDVKVIKVIHTSNDCMDLQRDINAVYRWSTLNKLNFNIKKCEMMSFTRSSFPHHHQYTLGGDNITRVTTVRDLGVLFDPQLTFREHALSVAKRAAQKLGFVLRNSPLLTPTALRALYAALVRSVLESNATVWIPHEDKYILIIEQVQKKFLRSLYKKEYTYYPYLYPTLFLLGTLRYNSLKVRRYLAVVKFALGIIRNTIDCSGLVGEVVRLYAPCARSRLRCAPLLSRPRARTNLMQHAPLPSALSVLNSVLDAAPSCDLFTTRLACLLQECKIFIERSLSD
jgi:hypothetical protein